MYNDDVTLPLQFNMSLRTDTAPGDYRSYILQELFQYGHAVVAATAEQSAPAGGGAFRGGKTELDPRPPSARSRRQHAIPHGDTLASFPVIPNWTPQDLCGTCCFNLMLLQITLAKITQLQFALLFDSNASATFNRIFLTACYVLFSLNVNMNKVSVGWSS